MWFPSLLRNRTRSDPGRRGRGPEAARLPTTLRPRLESLEGRVVPSTLTVTNTQDSGPGSLRAEIAAARNNSAIVFDLGPGGHTITLTSGELDITSSLTIQGPGAGLLT